MSVVRAPAVDDTAGSRTALVRRARRIGRILAETYPDASSELDFASPWQLLVVTVLSAQTTDRRVNAVSPALFARFPGPAELAAADGAEVEQIIAPTGFFRAKTQSIMKIAAAVCERHGGDVPASLDELLALPGVGRKTANVVLGNAFGIPGITVDTHVGRLARRFGWTAHTGAVKAEHDIAALFPPRDWTLLSHHLIWHGRRCCHARNPACGACPVARLCPSYGDGPTDPAVAKRLLRAEGRA